MQYEILDNIPAPKNGVSNNRYPFNKMDVGQCAIFPISVGSDFSESGIRIAANAIGRKHGKKFTVRVDRKGGVMRVWRIA
jgi:hypothetical protein